MGVQKVGNVLYAALSTGGLGILNVAEPLSAQWLSRLGLPGTCNDLAIVRENAFLALGVAGLGIVDVSDSTQPRLIQTIDTPGYATVVAIIEPTAYVADSFGGLQIIDVSSPGNARIIGTFQPGKPVSDVWVTNSMAFVASGAKGLQVLDVSIPSQPILIGSYIDPRKYSISSVCLQGSTAYVALQGVGILALDVSDPTKIAQIGQVAWPQIVSVTVHDSRLYARGVRSGRIVFALFDAVNPTNFFEIGSATLPVTWGRLQIDHNLAWLPWSGGGIAVIDMEDPEKMNISYSIATAGESGELVHDGDLLYVADGTAGLQILNTRDPANIQRIGNYSLNRPVTAVKVRDSIAGIIAGGHAFFLDVSDPSRITQVGEPTMAPEAFFSPGNLVINDQRAYFSGYGLWSVDISSFPISPMSNVVPASVQFYDSILQDSTLFATARDSIWIFDVADPKVPKLIGKHYPPRLGRTWGYYSFSIIGRVGYAITDSFGLETVDLRDYSHPSIFASSLPWISFGRVAGYGEWGFSSTSSGFATLDLRNPNNVPIVQAIPESAYSVNLGDNKAFLGRGARGVAVYHLPDVLPKIIAQPTGGIVESGQAFRLETSVSGTVPLTFQWSKDGVDIPGATNLHLAIESFAPQNAGDYVVAISNSSGIVRSVPASLSELGQMAFDKIGSIPQGGVQLHLADGTLFVANGRGIDRWDVTNPANPLNAGRIEISGVPQMQVFAVRVTNQVAYVAAGYGGLLIYSLNPFKYLGGIPGEVIVDVEVFGTQIFVAVSQGSLLSVDASNPVQPKIVGSWQRSYLPFSPLRLDTGGSYLLASVLSEGIVLFDPTQGGNPTPIGTSIADGFISGASVYKDWAVTMVSDSAHVIDLSDPSRPTTIARYPISKIPDAFAMSGALAYFATENGLEVLNVSEPRQPALIGHYSSLWNPTDMCVDGPYVYVADLVNGITILKSRPENGLYLHCQKKPVTAKFRWANGFGAVLQSASAVESTAWIDLQASKVQNEMEIFLTNEIRFFRLKVP